MWLTCLPPPLLGWALEDMEGPDAPPLLLFPVQLLHRISPWFPFFHMDDEFVLQTAQHGFKPSGIVSGHETTPGHEETSWVFNNEKKLLQLTVYHQHRAEAAQWHRHSRVLFPATHALQTESYDLRVLTIITTPLNWKPDCLFVWLKRRHCWAPQFLLLLRWPVSAILLLRFEFAQTLKLSATTGREDSTSAIFDFWEIVNCMVRK